MYIPIPHDANNVPPRIIISCAKFWPPWNDQACSYSKLQTDSKQIKLFVACTSNLSCNISLDVIPAISRWLRWRLGSPGNWVTMLILIKRPNSIIQASRALYLNPDERCIFSAVTSQVCITFQGSLICSIQQAQKQQGTGTTTGACEPPTPKLVVLWFS